MRQGIFFLLLIFSLSLVAQRTSYNNFSGDWNSSSSWTDGQPTSDDENDSDTLSTSSLVTTYGSDSETNLESIPKRGTKVDENINL